MKKVLSLILAVAMLASFAMVASAAEFAFEIALMDAAQENEVTEVNEGDKVYLTVGTTTKAVKYGIEINIDTTAFEISTYEEDGETYEEADFGAFTGSYAINPNGQKNVMAIGGVKTGAKGTISATIGLICKKAGTYEISFKGQQDKNMPADSTSTGNSVALTVKSSAPAESAYNVTYAGDKVVWGDKPATTVSSTDASKTVTFTVKPAFGYVITAVTGVATVLPEGGEMTATLTADTEIVVTVAEKADAAITYNYVTYDENYGWIAFGKVPAGTATYGIDLDGTKYAGANAANGAFGVGFKGLAAGSYTATAYAGETLAATSATITVAE